MSDPPTSLSRRSIIGGAVAGAATSTVTSLGLDTFRGSSAQRPILPAITRAAVPETRIPLTSLLTAGFDVEGDRGAGAIYKRGTRSGPLAIQDGAGRWFELAWNGGEINVGWCGAKGDGVADDTLAIRRAIDLCNIFPGSCLYLPRGRYRVNDSHGAVPLYADSSGGTHNAIFALSKRITVRGDGGSEDGSWVDCSGSAANSSVFAFAPTAVELGGVPIETVGYFWGLSGLLVKPADGASGEHALALVTSRYANIENAFIRDAWLWGGSGFGLFQFSTGPAGAGTIHQLLGSNLKLTGSAPNGMAFFQSAPDSLAMIGINLSGSGNGIESHGGVGTASALFQNVNSRGISGSALKLYGHQQALILTPQLEQGVANADPDGGLIVLDNCLSCHIAGAGNLNTLGNVGSAIVMRNNTRGCLVNDVTLNTKRWRPSRPYMAGERAMVRENNVYEVVTAGLSAATGAGPAGTDGKVPDGAVQWRYVGPGSNFHVTLTSDCGAGNVIGSAVDFQDDGANTQPQIQNASPNSLAYPGASSVTVNAGYVQHPNGMMEQWGVTAAGHHVTFPIPFPVGCDNVQLTPLAPSEKKGVLYAFVTNVSATGFVPVYRAAPGSSPAATDPDGAAYWLARGRWK